MGGGVWVECVFMHVDSSLVNTIFTSFPGTLQSQHILAIGYDCSIFMILLCYIYDIIVTIFMILLLLLILLYVVRYTSIGNHLPISPSNDVLVTM